MKKLPPSGYVNADDTSRPGYLAAKFKRLKREAEERAKQTASVVKPMVKPKVAHG